jgi:hypothetical protein
MNDLPCGGHFGRCQASGIKTNCYRSEAIRTTSLRFKYGNIPHGFCLPRIIKDVIIYAYGDDVQSVEKVLP